MLRDIPDLVVKDIALAVIPPDSLPLPEQSESLWNVYIINLKNEPITNVLVSSKGYGTIDGEQVKTSVLRHFIDVIEPLSYALVEPIDQSVFHLHNEYWISFYINKTIYDKKYMFVPGSLLEDNFSKIPILNKSGVMIRN